MLSLPSKSLIDILIGLYEGLSELEALKTQLLSHQVFTAQFGFSLLDSKQGVITAQSLSQFLQLNTTRFIERYGGKNIDFWVFLELVMPVADQALRNSFTVRQNFGIPSKNPSQLLETQLREIFLREVSLLEKFDKYLVKYDISSRETLTQIFKLIDSKKSGRINVNDFLQFLHQQGYNIKTDHARLMWRGLSLQKEQNLNEFLRLCPTPVRILTDMTQTTVPKILTSRFRSRSSYYKKKNEVKFL